MSLDMDVEKTALRMFPVSTKGLGPRYMTTKVSFEFALGEGYVYRPYQGVNEMVDSCNHLRSFTMVPGQDAMEVWSELLHEPLEVPLEAEFARMREQYPKVMRMRELPVQEWPLYIEAHGLQYVERV